MVKKIFEIISDNSQDKAHFNKYVYENNIKSPINKNFNPSLKKKLWTTQEDEILFEISKNCKNKKWKKASEILKIKTPYQCYVRFKTIDPKIKKGKWTNKEDEIVKNLVKDYGENWKLVSKILKSRSIKQIRFRYENYLKEGICLLNYSENEDNLLCKLYRNFKNKWSLYKKYLPNRSSQKIKRRIESLIKRNIILDDFCQNDKNNILLNEKKSGDEDKETIISIYENDNSLSIQNKYSISHYIGKNIFLHKINLSTIFSSGMDNSKDNIQLIDNSYDSENSEILNNEQLSNKDFQPNEKRNFKSLFYEFSRINENNKEISSNFENNNNDNSSHEINNFSFFVNNYKNFIL